LLSPKVMQMFLTENSFRFTIEADNFERLGGLRLFEICFGSNIVPKPRGSFSIIAVCRVTAAANSFVPLQKKRKIIYLEV